MQWQIILKVQYLYNPSNGRSFRVCIPTTPPTGSPNQHFFFFYHHWIWISFFLTQRLNPSLPRQYFILLAQMDKVHRAEAAAAAAGTQTAVNTNSVGGATSLSQPSTKPSEREEVYRELNVNQCGADRDCVLAWSRSSAARVSEAEPVVPNWWSVTIAIVVCFFS